MTTSSGRMEAQESRETQRERRKDWRESEEKRKTTGFKMPSGGRDDYRYLTSYVA